MAVRKQEARRQAAYKRWKSERASVGVTWPETFRVARARRLFDTLSFPRGDLSHTGLIHRFRSPSPFLIFAG